MRIGVFTALWANLSLRSGARPRRRVRPERGRDRNGRAARATRIARRMICSRAKLPRQKYLDAVARRGLIISCAQRARQPAPSRQGPRLQGRRGLPQGGAPGRAAARAGRQHLLRLPRRLARRQDHQLDHVPVAARVYDRRSTTSGTTSPSPTGRRPRRLPRTTGSRLALEMHPGMLVYNVVHAAPAA